MSARLFTTALCLFVASFASAAELTLVRVYSGWRDAASFKRISEYFDGKENTGGQIVLRTQPDQRAGYYFLVRVANPGAPRKVTARLQVITNTTAKPAEFLFSPELKSGESVFHLGLTGADWPDATTNPVAWKLELNDADGQTLISEQSYLWGKPVAQ
jgi:hypothetical protein